MTVCLLWFGRTVMRPFLLAGLIGVFLVFAGCIGPKPKPESKTEFWPPAPNPPRVQFLMGISDSRDVEGRKSGFSLFQYGDQQREVAKAIAKPYGVVADRGKVFVADSAIGKVLVIDLAKRKVEYLKGDDGGGKLAKPVNLAVDEEGNLYVVDTVRNEVMIYGPDGGFIGALGKGVVEKPVAVGVDGDFLFVVDFKTSEVKLLDRHTGKLLETMGSGGTINDSLSLPTNLTVDSAGFIQVVNMGSGKVLKMDRDGHVLNSFGRLGDGFGQFGRPKGIATDADGLVYIVDAAHQNVQIFSETGRLLMFFGGAKAASGAMSLPAGIAVSRDNLEYFQDLADPSFKLDQVVIVTNQVGKNKVSFYGMGKMKGVEYGVNPK